MLFLLLSHACDNKDTPLGYSNPAAASLLDATYVGRRCTRGHAGQFSVGADSAHTVSVLVSVAIQGVAGVLLYGAERLPGDAQDHQRDDQAD